MEKVEKVVKKLKERFYEMNVEEIGGICEEYVTVKFIKHIIKSIEEALNNAEVILAYKTEVIDGRDNGGYSDGRIEIVEPEDIKYYGIRIEDAEEVSVIKIEVDDYNAYLVLRELVEKEELDYCGMSSWNTLYILL